MQVFQYMTQEVEARAGIECCDETCAEQSMYEGYTVPPVALVQQWVQSGCQPAYAQLPPLASLIKQPSTLSQKTDSLLEMEAPAVGTAATRSMSGRCASTASSMDFFEDDDQTRHTPDASTETQSSFTSVSQQDTSTLNTYEPLSARRKLDEPVYMAPDALKLTPQDSSRSRVSSVSRSARRLSFVVSNTRADNTRSTNIDNGNKESVCIVGARTPSAAKLALPVVRRQSHASNSPARAMMSTIVPIFDKLTPLDQDSLIKENGCKNGMYCVTQLSDSQWRLAVASGGSVFLHTVKYSQQQFHVDQSPCPRAVQSISDVIAYCATPRLDWGCPLTVPVQSQHFETCERVLVHAR
jgi:hypothetical protein